MESVPLGEAGDAPGAYVIETGAALDGDGACIAEARRIAGDFLARARGPYGLAVAQRAVDLTQLVVSELVTNARKYAPGPVLLDLRIVFGDLDLVEVAVWDSDPVLPVARAADPGRVGQHGLEIVMAVVQEFEVRREPVGKRITARIPLAGTLAEVAGHGAR
ncbi:ATP-binding protein [Streptomyces tropicalis]|uniref:ATP-binding protein n=1 Tax=Streptomyces tropicalis TaxID=3034234 RepID=A0ABT6A2J1_9ACTN|nr:ATP-binding protein [Streptomyces tropicalis]MDF3298857.1 ATP-binding protein [Streptomyces tropicalis]